MLLVVSLQHGNIYIARRLSLKQGTGNRGMGMGTGNGNGEWESAGNLRGMTGESAGNDREICGE